MSIDQFHNHRLDATSHDEHYMPLLPHTLDEFVRVAQTFSPRSMFQDVQASARAYAGARRILVEREQVPNSIIANWGVQAEDPCLSSLQKGVGNPAVILALDVSLTAASVIDSFLPRKLRDYLTIGGIFAGMLGHAMQNADDIFPRN